MSKEIYISSTPHETRLAIVESDELTEIYYERENEYTLAGSIYNGKVTRVLPGMQSSFVDIGLERDAFLYITDFMEEAADTAEFDHSGDAPRAARGESQRGDAGRNGRDRDSGRNGSDRADPYVSERSQEQAAATAGTDIARASEGRGDEFGVRNDRGGRSRGRGRRDRGGNLDRPASTERTFSGESAPQFGEAVGQDEESRAGFVEEDSTANTPLIGSPEGASSELGEGAPGADGSRRWRGRRGRRRGRGTGPQDELTASSGPDGTASTDPFEAAETETQSFARTRFEEAASFDIDGSKGRERASIAHTVTPLVAQQPIQPSSSTRDRGGRVDRSRGGRNERGDQNQRPPRVPRGFTPTRGLYGVDSVTETEEAPYGQVVDSFAASGTEPEPLILPGESLSKYRKGGEESLPAAASVSASAIQDPGFKVEPGWDGGAMLPGETLSRYRGGVPQAGSSAGRAESRLDAKRSDGRRDGRNGRQSGSTDGRREGRELSADELSRRNLKTGQDFREPTSEKPATRDVMMVPSSEPALDLQSPGPVSGYTRGSEQALEIQVHQPDFAHAELPQPTAEAPSSEDRGLAPQLGVQHHGSIEQIDAAQRTATAGTEEIAPEQEYEPEGQSASYRVDPSAPSEYRQSSSSSVGDEARPDIEIAPSGEVFVVEPARGADGFSTHDATDEGMLVNVSAEAASFRADEEGKEPVSLGALHGETEGLRETGGALIGEAETTTPEVTTVGPTGEMSSKVASSGGLMEEEELSPGFAPGAGDLEEDFIEEEEIEAVSLHAHSDEDFDDLEEEEHLEGAADLGTMIRDMSLDHMTHSEGSIAEEEDDFEEDTLREDSEGSDSEEGRDFGSLSGEESFEEQGRSADGEEVDGLISKPLDGYNSSVGSERRGRRDNGRRGGRDRNGGSRDSGNRSGRPDRYAAPETNGTSDRLSSSERNGSSDRSGLGERARNTGGSSDRDRGRSSGRGGRQSMQMTNLPAISDLLKPGQEILCQIAKEPIAKKGARITSHIALPGRFLVFMPTVSHTGVSRKIESDAERRRLKEILLSEKGEAAGGFIVRTAAAGASEDELRSDLRFLLNLWADIKQRSDSSKSPALIYHDLNLVERILRDQVTDNFSAIWVDTETEYERVLRFLQRFQPGLIRRVKLYTKETPLFEQFGITEEINKALRSKVWLKSGGSIVINQTEALVAIDINTGKYVGKTARLEDTIVKTNLDAIPEIVRQIRLRDLGGIIIIDFIDMDERKNRNRVMAALEEELKTDRAPSKILPFNDFGLVAITRKRVKQSLERTLSTTCGVCTGTGMVKSPVTVCNDIYVEMRKMHKHLERGDVMLRVNPEVVKQLKSTGTHWLQEMEEMCGKTILIKSDPSLHPEQFDIH